MITYLLDFLFPRQSLRGQEGEWVTEPERQEMLSGQLVILEKAALVEMKIENIDRLVAAARYGESKLLKRAIRLFKYHRLLGLHHVLAELLDRAASHIDSQYEFVLCPVPLHWTRRFERGFNQAEALADMISASHHWPVRDLLKRKRATGHQAWRSGVERRAALTDAFVVGTEFVPKHILIIDDVATTGATLDACAKVLRLHGAAHVEALVIAVA